MVIIRKKPGENIDALIRRFKWAMEKDDILAELKAREFYKKPSQIKQDEIRALKQKIKEQNRKKKYYL